MLFLSVVAYIPYRKKKLRRHRLSSLYNKLLFHFPARARADLISRPFSSNNRVPEALAISLSLSLVFKCIYARSREILFSGR